MVCINEMSYPSRPHLQSTTSAVGWLGSAHPPDSSRSALFRANTATFENALRLNPFNGTIPEKTPMNDNQFRFALNRTNSIVFQRVIDAKSEVPGGSAGATNDRLLQRSATFVLSRHTGMKRTDSIWNEDPTSDNQKSIDGKDLETVGNAACRIFYASDWSPAVLHYSLDKGATWTQPPGKMMVEATGNHLADLAPSRDDLPKGCRIWVITLPDAPDGVTFVPNDNDNMWDNNANGNDYQVHKPGTYYLKNGHIKRLCLPPGRPIILVEKSIGVQTLELSWNPPIEGECDVAGYNIYRNGEKIRSMSMEEVMHIDRNEDKDGPICFEGFRNFVDYSLMGSTKYRYQVTAYNDNKDEGEPSTPLVIRTAEPDRPGEVENFWINRTAVDHIDLSWAAPLDSGGGIVEAYRIFRNGKSVAVLPAGSGEICQYRDSAVQAGEFYCYHVTAALSYDALKGGHRPILADIDTSDEASCQEEEEARTTFSSSPIDADEDDEDDEDSEPMNTATPSTHAEIHAHLSMRLQDLMSGGNIHDFLSDKKGERWLKMVEDAIEGECKRREGPPSKPKFAEARKQATLPKLFEQKPHILLQSFNWHSCHNKAAWYRVLKDHVPKMAEAGITLLWLPPPSQSVAPQGYMPSKLYDLNSAYGSAEQLKQLIRECQDNDISPMLDFVANHRCGSKQDSLGQWTMFEDPEWGPWAIVSNNKQGYRNVSSEQDSGAQSECAPDINHNNQQVQTDYKKWLMWLFNEIGFSSIRIDMAPGYGVNHQLNYLHTVGTPLTVGEYWSGDVNTLKNYVHKAQKKIAVYDFALYYVVRRAVETGDYSEMNNHGRLNGMVGQEPGLSITFLDNHDTEHLDFVGKFAGGDARKIMIGYAIILTSPGIPSIYWNHFSDYGEHMTKQITALGKLRQEANIDSTAKVSIHLSKWDGYVHYTTGAPDSNGVIKSLCLKVGHADNFHPSSSWKERLHGDGWAVYLK